MTAPTSGRAGPEGPPPAVLERFVAERVARLATSAALDALAERYPPYRRDRPPGPVVAVTPRRWAWWSAR